ncbi:hypothetical protein AQUCO_10400013v1 [Aquilegia coerulea]|uniref:Uncharacterized protein n=1 Tax=Aquilegia coerulea TaxID=218851 RepID=A0A2G5C3R8_AQUCA|nr:hypothetical protein AQUCO_10400013v1 [Aquilegia coerulea]
MADAVLGLLVENLSSLIQTEFGLLHSVKEKVEKLTRTLSTVRAVIEDAETRQQTDKAIAVWLKRLKDTAYDAEDVLDEWLTEVRHSELERSKVTQSFASWFHFNKPVFRHKIAKKIKKVHADFDSIAGDILKFDLKTRVVERVALLDPNRETSSLLVEPEQVYGRDEDKRKIVDMLISIDSGSNDISVFSIVGIGGLGKTTLAQLVYNDGKLSNHFEVRIWVCVAEYFDVKRILKCIIESLNGKATDLETLDALQSLLKTLLSGRKFLLVLDDVWNCDQDKWDKVKFSLTCGAKGSSILVTTRLEEVALIMGGLSAAYPLTPLSEDECWYLFNGRALGMGNEDLFPELVTIGREIVLKCKGIPLAAKVLGTVLHRKRDVSAWSSIRDNKFWELPEEEGGAILGALRLSYSHLSPQHRQCFSYCSIYPKGYEMEKEELVQLWIANGFVQCVGRIELDDVGNQIFNDLLRGSFFQDAQIDHFGNIVKCKMHDLMHDLACSLSLSECCVVEGDNKETIPKSMRHVSLALATDSWEEGPSGTYYNLLCESNKRLRTHLLIGGFSFFPSTKNLWKLKYLRVLDLKGSPISHLPNSIKHMKCLRYLDLSRTELRSLPKSVCSLLNLQTLKLGGCEELGELPRDMKSMISLRHLDLRKCVKLTNMPSEMGQMIWLRTLSRFNVPQSNGQQISVLNGLNHLGGELSIFGLENVKDSREAKQANLVNKSKLCSLEMFWGIVAQEEEEMKKKESEGVIECLQPHPNLKKLVIVGYLGGTLALSWMKILFNLVEIKLEKCIRLESVPPLGHLPLLKILTLSKLDSLKCIETKSYGGGGEGGSRKGFFPSLEKLQVKDMANLEKWVSDGDGDDEKERAYPNLREFRINECPNLKTLSLRNLSRLSSIEIRGIPELESSPEGFLRNLTAVETLTIYGCNQLKSIPNDDINNLTALKSLEITYCNELILPAEGLQKITSLNLKALTIYSCSIKTLPAMGRMIQQGMMMKSSCCSLVFLKIGGCYSLTSVSKGLRYLTSLEILQIYGCIELKLERKDFQNLTSLRLLYLDGLPKLTSVPDVQNLTVLQSLRIEFCKNLNMLPEGIQQHLSSLQSLRVCACHPDLHKRLKREEGIDWPNISHIPSVSIDPTS